MSRENSLVTAQWVEDNLDTDGVVLIEVDEDTTAYDKGHIRGAIKLDWTTDLQDQVRRDFVNKEQFEALLSERGVANDDTVVLYGGNNNWFAAYAYWYFKLYGHQDVKLLDGGRKKWELDSRELTDELPTRATTSYTAQEQDPSIRAFRDEVVAAIGTQNLVDVRSPDEYAGRLLAPAHLPQEQAQRAGHIPTSVNVPWSKNANDDGTFKSDEELTALYDEVGFDTDKDTIALCRIGERSSLTWFVLTELLGRKNVKNYDGSWTEYGSLVGVPVALGDEPGRGLMCGATEGGLSLDGVNVAKEAVIQGQVLRGRRARRQRLRPAARPHRRVHRRGADVRDGALPLLRRRRRVDPADAGAEGRAGRHPRRRRDGLGRRGAGARHRLTRADPRLVQTTGGTSRTRSAGRSSHFRHCSPTLGAAGSHGSYRGGSGCVPCLGSCREERRW